MISTGYGTPNHEGWYLNWKRMQWRSIIDKSSKSAVLREYLRWSNQKSKFSTKAHKMKYRKIENYSKANIASSSKRRLVYSLQSSIFKVQVQYSIFKFKFNIQISTSQSLQSLESSENLETLKDRKT